MLLLAAGLGFLLCSFKHIFDSYQGLANMLCATSFTCYTVNKVGTAAGDVFHSVVCFPCNCACYLPWAISAVVVSTVVKASLAVCCTHSYFPRSQDASSTLHCNAINSLATRH